MADPTTAGGGTEGLRDDLVEWLRHRFDLGRWQADAHAASLLERGPLADFFARASAEQARVEAENGHLRASLANSGGPCAYCNLPRQDWAKCASGFPGCGRADDAMLCPNVGAWLEYGERVATLEAALAPFVAHRAWARRHEWPADIAEDPATPILGASGDEGQMHGEVTVGDFDRAADALAQAETEAGGQP